MDTYRSAFRVNFDQRRRFKSLSALTGNGYGDKSYLYSCTNRYQHYAVFEKINKNNSSIEDACIIRTEDINKRVFVPSKIIDYIEKRDIRLNNYVYRTLIYKLNPSRQNFNNILWFSYYGNGGSSRRTVMDFERDQHGDFTAVAMPNVFSNYDIYQLEYSLPDLPELAVFMLTSNYYHTASRLKTLWQKDKYFLNTRYCSLVKNNYKDVATVREYARDTISKIFEDYANALVKDMYLINLKDESSSLYDIALAGINKDKKDIEQRLDVLNLIKFIAIKCTRLARENDIENYFYNFIYNEVKYKSSIAEAYRLSFLSQEDFEKINLYGNNNRFNLFTE